MLRPSPIPKSSPRSKSSAAEELYGVRFTHPDRVVFQDAGITKRDLADYCAAVADWMLPHLVHRPLTLVRCPEGTGKPCFYQKQPPQGLPRKREADADSLQGGLLRRRLRRRLERAAGADPVRRAGNSRLAGERRTISSGPTGSCSISTLGPTSHGPRVVDAALLLRDSLKELSLVSFVKTTGGKGLHIVVPIEPQRPWSEVKEFSKAMAQALVVADPSRYTLSMSKAARPGKIFIDYLRNERGATAVVAYSPRARAGAPVSLPLDWKELRKTRAGNAATVDNVLAAIKKAVSRSLEGSD